MRFAYNSDLKFGDRVALVRQEIQDEYPLINEHDATVAAALATPVDDRITSDDKFDRYYFIMYTIKKFDNEFSHVFNDAFNLYEQGFQKKSNQAIMKEIVSYMAGDQDIFPELVNE